MRNTGVAVGRALNPQVRRYLSHGSTGRCLWRNDINVSALTSVDVTTVRYMSPNN